MKVSEQTSQNNNNKSIEEKKKDKNKLKLLIQLNSIAYSANKVESIEALKVEEDLQGYEIVDATCNYKDLQTKGLKAAVFYNGNTKHIVVAFAGTNPKEMHDLIDDLNLVSGGKITKMEDLKSFLNESIVKSNLEIKNISVVGHSLGSVIADLANVELTNCGYKTDATLFESPGSNHSVINEFKGLTPEKLAQIKTVTYNSKPNIINNGNVFSVSDSSPHRGEIFVIPTSAITTKSKPVTFKKNPKDKKIKVQNKVDALQDLSMKAQNKVDVVGLKTKFGVNALNNIYRKLKDLRLNVYRQLKRFILKKKPEDKKIEDLNNPNSLQNLSKELGKAGPEIAGFTTKFGMIGLSNVYTQFNNVKEHGISAIYNNLENGSNPYKVEYGYNNKENGSPSIEIVMEPAEFTELKTFVAKNVKQTLSLIKAARRYKGLTSTEQYVVKSALLKLEFDDSFEVVDNLVDISSEELGQFLQHKYTNLNSKLNPALKEDIVILDDVKAAVQEFVTSNSSFKSINNNSKKSLTYTSHSSRLS